MLRSQKLTTKSRGAWAEADGGAEVKMSGENEHNGGRKGRRPLPRPGAGTTEMEAHGSPAEMEAHGSRRLGRRGIGRGGRAPRRGRERGKGAGAVAEEEQCREVQVLRSASRKSSAERWRRLGPAKDNRAGRCSPLPVPAGTLLEEEQRDGGRWGSSGRRTARERQTARRKTDGVRRTAELGFSSV